MDRKKLIEKLNELGNKKINEEEISKTIEKSIDCCKSDFRYICIEEMSELIKEITKNLRGSDRKPEDKIGIMEEIADTYYCLLALMKIYNIEFDEILRCLKIKSDRINKKIERGNFK